MHHYALTIHFQSDIPHNPADAAHLAAILLKPSFQHITITKVSGGVCQRSPFGS